MAGERQRVSTVRGRCFPFRGHIQLFVVNDGQFSIMMTVKAYYSTVDVFEVYKKVCKNQRLHKTLLINFNIIDSKYFLFHPCM